MRKAGLLYGHDKHFLDHIAPLCSLLEIPLIVSEEEIAHLARSYYPHLQVTLCNYSEMASYLLDEYETLFTCMPRPLFDELFFIPQQLARKRLRTIWLPHGNSDKGQLIPLMEGLKHEETLLVYGQKMVEFLKQKGALQKHHFTGNYRLFFYEQQRSFYKALVTKQIEEKFPKKQTTLLFAPTWKDQEDSCSFFDAFPHLASHLPKEMNLIVKLHPNLLIQEGRKIEQLQELYGRGILFLNDFPPIYPLLDLVDIYIGDMSSIGYDFLAFDKPLFFLNQQNRSCDLFSCGVEISPSCYKEIFSIIEKALPNDMEKFSPVRKKLYAYTFEEPFCKTVLHAC